MCLCVCFLLLRHHWSQNSQAGEPQAVLFSALSGENLSVCECIKCQCVYVCLCYCKQLLCEENKFSLSCIVSSVTQCCLFTWIFFKINSLSGPLAFKNMFGLLSVCWTQPYCDDAYLCITGYMEMTVLSHLLNLDYISLSPLLAVAIAVKISPIACHVGRLNNFSNSGSPSTHSYLLKGHTQSEKMHSFLSTQAGCERKKCVARSIASGCWRLLKVTLKQTGRTPLTYRLVSEPLPTADHWAREK